MKKTILFLSFIFFQVATYSQDFDLIITTEGDSIICRTDSITDSYYYLDMLVLDKWIPSRLGKIDISDYQPKVINKEVVDLRQGKAKIKIYKAWIIPISFTLEMNGILYEIKDSSIALSSSSGIEDYYVKNFETIDFHINDIMTIKVRRINNIGRGVWIGFVTGFGMGGLMGLLFGGDSYLPRESVALNAAFSSSLVGAGLGALIGAIHVKIPINGDINTYNLNKKRLKKYSLQFEN